MSLADVVARLTTGTYDVTRPSAGGYVAGAFVVGAPTTFSVRASIQPVNPRDLQRLPEGERSTDRIVIYSTDELKTGDAGAQTLSDRVAYRGMTYEVESVNRWDESGGLFKSIARKVER